MWHTIRSASLKSNTHLVLPHEFKANQTNVFNMKSFTFALALFAVVAYATAQLAPESMADDYELERFRREANPQGSIVLTGKKPLGGHDRRPSLDVDYHQQVYDRNGLTASSYGGLNIRPGQPPQPHIGIQAERTYRDGFLRGFGQVQRGPGGRPDPTFGLSGGFRFRRDVRESGEEEQAY